MKEKGRKTKERILQAAYQLFAQKGFRSVTMTDVCKQTGLSRGGVYRYYSSTKQLFTEIMSTEYVIADRIERQESATAILEDMLEAIRTEIMDKEQSLSLAIYEYAILGNQAFFTELNDRAKRRWISLLQYGMETGEFQQIDTAQLSDVILYYYHGLRLWSRMIPIDAKEAEYYVLTIRQLLGVSH